MSGRGLSALLLAAVLEAISVSAPAAAQDAPTVDIQKANAFAAKFAVPESPAFSLLDVDASSILRPATVKDLAVSLGGFRGNGLSLALPGEVGIEVSPGLMVKGRTLSLSEYQRHPWLYRARVSVSTRRSDSTSSATKLAYGLRISLEDQADLRTNGAYIAYVEHFHAAHLKMFSQFQDSLVAVGAADPETAGVIATLLADPDSAPAGLTKLDAIMASRNIPGPQKQQLRSLARTVASAVQNRKALEQFRDSLQNEAWNANSFDVAVGGLASADDSTGANLENQEWAAWATMGRRLTSSGQLLLGAQGAVVRDMVGGGWSKQLSLAGRVYLGSNRLKGLAETQLKWQQDLKRVWFVRFGVELEPSFGGWVKLVAGIKNDGGSDGTKLLSDFSYNLSLQNILNAVR